MIWEKEFDELRASFTIDEDSNMRDDIEWDWICKKLNEYENMLENLKNCKNCKHSFPNKWCAKAKSTLNYNEKGCSWGYYRGYLNEV